MRDADINDTRLVAFAGPTSIIAGIADAGNGAAGSAGSSFSKASLFFRQFSGN